MACEMIYPEKGGRQGIIMLNHARYRLDQGFNRKGHEKIQAVIAREKTILEKGAGPFLYNRPKYRFHSYEVKNRQLTINLGLTDYFDYLVTNHNRAINTELVKLGLKTDKDPDRFLSNALGNAAVVRSSDDRIILLHRSCNVQTFTGYIDLPGGHPEPDRIKTKSPAGSRIKAELFSSIKQEMAEELNILESDIRTLINIGFMRSLEDGRKPEMLFYISLDLHSDHIYRSFKKIQKAGSEARDLVFLDMDDFHSTNLKMTAVAKKTLMHFLKIRDGLYEHVS